VILANHEGAKQC